jgi:hypothetical protein
MPRTLTVLFRRDPSRDRQSEQVRFEGYQVCWPDGRPVAVGLDAFCAHGQRLLGLGRHLKGRTERQIELLCFPLRDREADMTKLPGARVRRFLLRRNGREGRIHFLDGTPTAAVFDLGADEQSVLHWIGLPALKDGGSQWIDLAARAAEPAHTPPPPIEGSLSGVFTGV